MTENERLLAQKNGTLETLYADKVAELIRKKYTQNDEFALLRQREQKQEEFATYNAYVEQCKATAHSEIYGTEVK